MPLYAASLSALMPVNNKKVSVLGCYLVDASNEDEARGKAYAAALKCFPTRRGWGSHLVYVTADLLPPLGDIEPYDSPVLPKESE